MQESSPHLHVASSYPQLILADSAAITFPVQFASQHKTLPANNHLAATFGPERAPRHSAASGPKRSAAEALCAQDDDLTAGERVIPSERLAGFEDQGVRLRRPRPLINILRL